MTLGRRVPPGLLRTAGYRQAAGLSRAGGNPVKKAIALAAAVVAVLGVVAPADAHYRIAGKSHACNGVSFMPPGQVGDYGAFRIRTKGISCATARHIVRVDHRIWLHNQRCGQGCEYTGPPMPRWVSCEFQARPEGHQGHWLGHADYRCRSKRHPRRRVVVWTAT